MDYKVIYSNRRTLCLQIKSDSSIIVRAPKRTSKLAITQFIEKHLDWISKKLALVASRPKFDSFTNDEIKELKHKVLELVLPRVEYFSKIMSVTPNKISVTSAKKRLGSCSSTGNINFSFRLAFYTMEIIDYIVVHELAHIKEMNHSKQFWKIVEAYIPNYKELKKKL